MERFQANQYLTKKEKRELAMSLSLTEQRIAHWYTKMRYKKAAEGTFVHSELCPLFHYPSTLMNTYTSY